MATQPDTVIAYEPEAADLLLRATPVGSKTRRIVHLHEIPCAELYAASRFGRSALRRMLAALHHADLVVMPDLHRAKFVQSLAGLKSMPQVVMNCPRRLAHVPDSRLLPFLRQRGITTSQIVHYQGAVGPHHHLDTVIRSMRMWPQESVFVIVGGGIERHRVELQVLAAQEGVQDRVLFVGRVPYDHVFAYAVGAALGVTLLDPSNKNWELSAGASNKRFEYMALGIPQVTNEGTGVREVFARSGAVAFADHRDVADIGCKIVAYLRDLPLRCEAGVRARRLHMEEFNYERQFQPILEFVKVAFSD